MRSLWMTALVLASVPVPSPWLRAQSRIERDIAYGRVSPEQRLDFYAPQARGFPTVIFIHGGSLQSAGDRRSTPLYAGVCPRLVESGIGCATIDYRLAPEDKWPAMPNDVASATKWVIEHVAERGGDPHRIVLFGHSSGCLLSAVVATNPKYLAAVGLTPADLAGVVAMGCMLSPAEDMTSRLTLDQIRARWSRSTWASTYATADDFLDGDPSRFLGSHVPPMLVICADFERFFPPILEEGARMVRRLLEMRRPANLVIVPGRHVSSIAEFGQPSDPTFTAVKAFVEHPENVAPGGSLQ